MKKLDKYIQKSNFVKVFIGNDEGTFNAHFEGIVFNYTSEFLFMCDLADFNPDGFVVLRKADITEVRRTENEAFFEKIVKGENIHRQIRLAKSEVPFRLGTMQQMFSQLAELQKPVIIESLYDAGKLFQIGDVKKAAKSKVKINYYNSAGELDKDLISIDFENITYFRFDSPYANLFKKYGQYRDVDTEEVVLHKIKKKKTETEIVGRTEDALDETPEIKGKEKKKSKKLNKAKKNLDGKLKKAQKEDKHKKKSKSKKKAKDKTKIKSKRMDDDLSSKNKKNKKNKKDKKAKRKLLASL